MSRYWFDSFPGIDLDGLNPILDFYKTPYGGPEDLRHVLGKNSFAIDNSKDPHAPYTTVSQNRGGIA
jgi:hypothetical protein